MMVESGVAHALVPATSRLVGTLAQGSRVGGSSPSAGTSLGVAGTNARATLTVCLCLVLVSLTACRGRRETIRVQQTDEDAATLASVVHVADPRATPQLLKGFHPVEQNAWRWTTGQFSVALRPPRNAAQKGAVLQLKFSIPEPVIARFKTVSLSAGITGGKLSPETYTQGGEFVYQRDVDPKYLTGDAVTVDFTLDKFLPPSESDQRELGVVVSSIGLEAK
ncbi:MAG: hypothetical protein ACRD8O_11885 [Bryobacteraceae bacterium]